MSCPGRHHDYGADGKCKRCGDPKRGPGRPKAAGPRKLGAEALARLVGPTDGTGAAVPPAAAQGTTAGPSSGPPSSAAPDLPAAPSSTGQGATPDTKGKPAPPAKPPTWCRSAGKRLANLFVAGTEWVIEKFDREPGEPDEDDVEEFGEAMGEQLAVWLPDTELGPGGKLLLAGTFIAAEMAATSKKLPPKPRALPPAPAPAPQPQVSSPAEPGRLSVVRAHDADTTSVETHPRT